MSEEKRDLHDLEKDVTETGARIRRYMLDRHGDGDDFDTVKAAHDKWLEVWKDLQKHIAGKNGAPSLRDVRERLMGVDWDVDVIQRNHISRDSKNAGTRTVLWLAVALVLLVAVYLYSHGVRSLDFAGFEPFSEWGPLKYVEVAYWSTFGVLCWLLFLASRYTLRRDFDAWYKSWYVSTALRAPFLTIVLMMIVLEFSEWYGEGTWIETYLLEEGNKFYFIAFMSFCLGLMSDETATIVRELSDGVIEFVHGAVQKLTEKFRSTFSLQVPTK